MADLTPTPPLLALTPGQQALIQAFAAHHTLERLLRDAWAAGTDLHDVVVMDEYTHDVVLPLPPGLLWPGQPPLYLAYDST